MAADMRIWRRLVEDQVDDTANEDMQRRAWFGIGPEADSPDERFNKFLGDASVEDFLERSDTGFNEEQIQSLRYLTKLMRNLCNETEDYPPPTFIDDHRWQKVIAAAKETKKILGIITLSDDVKNWRRLIEQQVNRIASGEYLRSVWLGTGNNGWDAPFEHFNKFFRDVDVSGFLMRNDTGLNKQQLQSILYLKELMLSVWDETIEERKTIPEEKLLETYSNDPRWKKVEAAAQHTQKILG